MLSQEFKALRGLCARGLYALVILYLLSPVVLSVTGDLTRFRAGLRNGSGSRKLKLDQLKATLESLRGKTGFLDMRFDEAGFLTLGDRTRFTGGSSSARELLIATVDGRQAIELEAHNNSPQIAFARLTAGNILTGFQTGARIEVRQVQLDFADFAELRGEREAVAAFDLGFAVLHELVHSVLSLSDVVSETTELGACDEQINRMRRELNLPERQGYSARARSKMHSSNGTTRLAELVFAYERVKPASAGSKLFYLRWDAKRVASAAESK